MDKQEQLDALNKWLAEWEPYYQIIQQSIIEKYGDSSPEALAELNDLALQFAKLRHIATREAAKRQGN